MQVIQRNSDTFKCFIGLDGATVDKPSNGGLRLNIYESENLALEECKNLSLVMSDKHSLYNTGFNGGKIVAFVKEHNTCKKEILNFVGSMLQELNGLMYTGCDLNTSLEDMEYLRNHCPYILAALDSRVDPSIATAYGVVGSIQGIFGNCLKNRTFMIHGLGKVGTAAALKLQSLGAKVMTYDILSSRANLPNCTNVSDRQDWWNIECDALVPCSISGLITPEIASLLNCRYIVGSANLPLSEDLITNILNSKSILFIPEAISSAGAIISDSVEFYNPSIFKEINPEFIYSFIQELVRKKTQEFLVEQKTREESYIQVLSELSSLAEKEPKAGELITDFLNYNLDESVVLN